MDELPLEPYPLCQGIYSSQRSPTCIYCKGHVHPEITFETKNSEGELRQYESTTSIGHIREIVNQLLSDRNTIGSVQAVVIMRDNGILGLAKELKVTKTVDEQGKLKLDIEMIL